MNDTLSSSGRSFTVFAAQHDTRAALSVGVTFVRRIARRYPYAFHLLSSTPEAGSQPLELRQNLLCDLFCFRERCFLIGHSADADGDE